MEERNILSTEEVEALIKAAQSASLGADDISNTNSTDESSTINTSAFNNILENTRSDIENKLTVLLRSKIAVKNKPPVLTNIEELLKQGDDAHIYSSFKLMPYDMPVMICIEKQFIDVSINLLYGGKNSSATKQPAPIGKIGGIIAEKMSQALLDSFNIACADYAKLSYANPKTTSVMNNANYFSEESAVQTIVFEFNINEIESKLFLYLSDEFLKTILPVKTGRAKHRDSDFWRGVIKDEVIDSYITISTTISDVPIKVKDFINLKEGDEIPISDPTLVFVCMNNLKLFRALAGQSNSKLVAKIVSQI